MKTHIVTTLTLLVTTTVEGNIFKNMQESLRKNSVNIDNYNGIQKIMIPNTNMYYYKFAKTDPTSSPTDKTKSVVVESHPVLEHPVVRDDHPKYDPIVSKTPKTLEVGAQVQKQEVDHVYGKTSPLRDDAVATAWEKSNQADKRLDDHRKYMEKLRKLRLEKAAAKEIDAAKNSD